MLNRVVYYFCIMAVGISVSSAVFAVDFSNKLQIKISPLQTDGKFIYNVLDGVNGGVSVTTQKTREAAYNGYCRDYAGKGFYLCVKQEVEDAISSGNLITPVDGYTKTAYISNNSGGLMCNKYSNNSVLKTGIQLKIENAAVTFPSTGLACNNVHNIACCKLWRDDEY